MYSLVWCSNTASNISQWHPTIFVNFCFYMHHHCFWARDNSSAFPFSVEHSFLLSWKVSMHLKNIARVIIVSPYTDNKFSDFHICVLNFHEKFRDNSLFNLRINFHVRQKSARTILNILCCLLRNYSYTWLIDLKFCIHILDWCRNMAN